MMCILIVILSSYVDDNGVLCPKGEEVVVHEGDTFRILFLNYHSVHVYVNTLILEQTGTKPLCVVCDTICDLSVLLMILQIPE